MACLTGSRLLFFFPLQLITLYLPNMSFLTSIDTTMLWEPNIFDALFINDGFSIA
jgi:hypothetical protein